MRLQFLIFAFAFIFIFSSCKDTSPQPSDLVGSYTVTLSLREGVLNTSAIKDSINDAMTKVGEELKKARLEMNNQLDFSSIDTTTAKGKIEFAAKKFGKSMAEVGIGMGELGKEMGSLFSGLAEGGVGMTKSLLENMTFDVELQADGDIKTSRTVVNMGLNDKAWKVVGDEFIVLDKNNIGEKKLKISDRDAKGFTLTNDDILIRFNKK